MRQNDVPHASGLLNLTETKRDLVGILPSLAKVWLFVLVMSMLAPLAHVFAHGQHESKVTRGGDQARRASILLHSRCAMCHSADIVLQQRLDRLAWQSEIERMVKWGAPLDDEDRQLLVAYLARHHGPDHAGTQANPDRMEDVHANSAILAQGRPKNGNMLYRAHCADCHGTKGEGHDGPPLTANPILTMDSVFVEVVRQGRGGMPPWAGALSSQELADIQVWLRTLR